MTPDETERMKELAEKVIHKLGRGAAIYVAQAYLDLLAKQEGMKLVPLEPTREMWAAMADAFIMNNDKHHDVAIKAIYKAMINVKP